MNNDGFRVALIPDILHSNMRFVYSGTVLQKQKTSGQISGCAIYNLCSYEKKFLFQFFRINKGFTRLCQNKNRELLFHVIDYCRVVVN